MLVFEDLWAFYGDFAALKGLNLELHQGEMVTLLGPSGCGKSTVIKIAGGFLRPSAGQILLQGRDISELPPEKRPTATVFQHHALFPHRTVEENLAYGLQVRGVDRTEQRRRVEEALELVRLRAMGSKRVQELSGGQQQRVALARALILRPQLLLLDEPLSSLDAKLRTSMRQEIRAIQRALAITALYVTHDQEEALSVSDRVAVMDGGRLVQTGTPQEVYFYPQSPFVAQFIAGAFPVTLGGLNRFLRPDQIVLDPEGPLEGVVTSLQFLGALVEISLKWQGQNLRCRVASRQAPKVDLGSVLRFRIED